MFPLLDKERNKIILIQNVSTIEVREDKEGLGHYVRVDDGIGSVLFTGNQVECEHFLEQLFYAIRDTRGAEGSQLAQRARAYAAHDALSAANTISEDA